MRRLNIKRKIQNTCIIGLVTLILLITTVPNIALAAGAVDSDPGVGGGNITSGTNTTSISDARKNGVAEEKIKEAIKKAIIESSDDYDDISDEDINKIYTATTQDATKIKITFTMVQGNTTSVSADVNGIITPNKNGVKAIDTIRDGTYQPNLGTEQDEIHQNEEREERTGLEGENQGDIGGVLFGPIAWLLQAIGDVANEMLQRVLLGTWDSVFYSTGWMGFSDGDVTAAIDRNPPISNLTNVNIVKNYIKGLTNNYGIPEIKITPVDIFAGNVAALDANFFAEDENIEDKLGGQERSIVVQLKKYIAQWYVALRNIAIVGLLSVLLYIGIRIIISSSAGDKAKYKQMFTDWVIALCLIFFMHYIMAFTMTMAETVTKVLAGPTDDNTKQNGTIKQVNIVFTDENGSPDGTSFSSSFTGVARVKADYQDSVLKMGYTILYIGLTGYAIYFTIVYLKRLLMLAFFTMIAPLVALTYPIDKVKDGKAQAFNYWFKEYMFYALLQPMHMVLYTVLVSSAIQIAADNLLYAIVALAFIVPAEKILKQMFGIKGQTESSIAGFAGGAIATQAFNALRHGGQGKKTQAGGEKPVRTFSNPNTPDAMETLANNAMALDSLQGKNEINPPQNTEESSALKDTAVAAAKGAAEGKAIEAAVAKANEENRETLETSEHDSGTVEQQNDKENEANRQLAEMKAKGLTLGQNSGTLPQTQSNNKEENKFSAYRKQLANNFKKAAKRRFVAAGGWKGIGKNAAIGLGKGYIKTAGAIAGTALGTGLGIVGGDLGDIAKGGTAGFVAGAYTGSIANKAISNAGNSSVGSFLGEVLQGDDYSKQQSIKRYMNNAEYRQKIMEENPDISLEELNTKLRKQAEMGHDIKSTNYSKIKAATKLEEKLEKEGIKNAHDIVVADMKLAENYDISTFIDDNKFENAQKQLRKNLERQIIEQNREQHKEVNQKQIAQQADAAARQHLEYMGELKGVYKHKKKGV